MTKGVRGTALEMEFRSKSKDCWFGITWAEKIVEAARLYATSKPSLLSWGLGNSLLGAALQRPGVEGEALMAVNSINTQQAGLLADHRDAFLNTRRASDPKVSMIMDLLSRTTVRTLA